MSIQQGRSAMASPSNAVATPTDEQRALLAKLSSVSDMIEGYKATIFMLERERMQLMTKLRLAGYRPPEPEARP